jgi:hypothetical protein
MASLLCLLILAATVPSLGHHVRSTRRTLTVEYGWHDALWILMIVAPLVLVLFGVFRSRTVEGIGWAWLILLLVLMSIF